MLSLLIKPSSFSCEQQMPPHREPSPGPTSMDMICQFNKLKPPKFDGGAAPLRYEE